MECHDIVVDKNSRKLRQGGQQCLTTVEGYNDTLVPTLFVNTSSLAFPLSMFTNAMNMSQTNTIFSDTPAFANGSTCAQIFVGTKSLVTDAYGIKTDGKFVATSEDNIQNGE